jgi:hypothetical protein
MQITCVHVFETGNTYEPEHRIGISDGFTPENFGP